jgi:hypothetical protein
VAARKAEAKRPISSPTTPISIRFLSRPGPLLADAPVRLFESSALAVRLLRGKDWVTTRGFAGVSPHMAAIALE